MIYVWAAIAIAVLFLVWQIIRWINLPKTIEERRKAQEARSKAWADWRANRPRLFGRRNVAPPETPAQEKPVLPPTPDTAEAIKRIQEQTPKDYQRKGLRARIRARQLERKHGR